MNTIFACWPSGSERRGHLDYSPSPAAVLPQGDLRAYLLQDDCFARKSCRMVQEIPTRTAPAPTRARRGVAWSPGHAPPNRPTGLDVGSANQRRLEIAARV